MPVIIKLNPGPYKMPTSWCTRDEWERLGRADLQGIIAEDIYGFLAKLAHTPNGETYEETLEIVERLVASVEWVDD